MAGQGGNAPDSVVSEEKSIMALHKGSWPKQTWDFPLPHDYTFSFGLDIDDVAVTKHSTIIPYVMQDNAIVDYETIKTNPENEDFAVVAKPNCGAGSYVPRCTVSWKAFCPVIGSAELDILQFKYMPIHTAMLSRLDAFDKKTGNDIETILELTHETTDEQAYMLGNDIKLYEGHGVNDLPSDVPGLDTTTQPEGCAFDMELYFDALHYYTNKEMLRTVTGRMLNYTTSAITKAGRPTDKIMKYYSSRMPSICKYMQPYTLYAGLFHAPAVSTQNQFMLAGDVTPIEHITFLGRVRFNEYNPDFNFARA